jgi:hypothetical protein
MQRTIAVAIPLVVSVLAASCNSTTARDNLTQPTPVAAELSASFGVVSPSVSAQVASPSTSGCPAQAPFSVPIDLIVRANRDLRVFITVIRLRFIDPFNIQMPQVTLTAPELTRQFGTNLVQARSARTFPLQVAVGCGTGKSGIVTVGIDTQDEQGRSQSGQISVAVH